MMPDAHRCAPRRSSPGAVRFPSKASSACSLPSVEHRRTRGSHRPLSIQPKGGEAKPYQIAQFMAMVEEFDLRDRAKPDCEGPSTCAC
jgi:hypothetical protein